MDAEGPRPNVALYHFDAPMFCCMKLYRPFILYMQYLYCEQIHISGSCTWLRLWVTFHDNSPTLHFFPTKFALFFTQHLSRAKRTVPCSIVGQVSQGGFSNLDTPSLISGWVHSNACWAVVKHPLNSIDIFTNSNLPSCRFILNCYSAWLVLSSRASIFVSSVYMSVKSGT